MNDGLRNGKPLFPVLLDYWKVYKPYEGRGRPNTFIIDRDGNIRYIHQNYKY